MEEEVKNKTEESEKRKHRGRPSKKQALIENEEKEYVRMSEKNSTIQPQTPPQQISFSDISQRWQSIFSRYANSLGVESIVNAYTNQGNFLNNPFLQNARVKSTMTKGQNLSKEDLKNALKNPMESERALRAMSAQLYYQNYVYQNLIRVNRNIPKYNYYYEPLYVEGEGAINRIKKDSVRVDKALKKLDPKLTFKTISEQVYIEGKSTYFVRTSYSDKDVNYFVLQKLNSDNVKITGFGSTERFITSFDMSLFLNAGYSIYQYPSFIQEAWKQMNSIGVVATNDKGFLEINPKTDLPRGHRIEANLDTGSYHYWVELPQNLAWTFYTTGANAGQIPDLVPMFTDFKELEDYRWLMGQLVSKGVTSVITGEVPLAYQPKDGLDQTALTPDVIMGYTDLFNRTVSDNVVGFFAPFTDYKMHSVDNQPDNLNILYTRTRDLIATAGQSSLVSISEKPSISSTQTARMLAESSGDYLTAQYEEFINYVINNAFDLACEWRVVLHSGIFNWREDAKIVKELVQTAGMKGLVPRLLSYFDQTPEDYKGSMLLLEALDIKLETEKDKEEELNMAKKDQNMREQDMKSNIEAQKEQLKIQSKVALIEVKEGMKIKADQAKAEMKLKAQGLTSTAGKPGKSSTSSTTATKNGVGRPSKSEDSVTNDSTAASKDSGANVSENKKMAKIVYQRFEDHKCVKCGCSLEEDEDLVCSDCLEEIAEDRGGLL